MRGFDISPFRLPGSPAGEYRFEEPRDIAALEVAFRRRIPRAFKVEYLSETWPRVRFEHLKDMQDPARFGWVPMDDQWNSAWRAAAISRKAEGRTVRVTFKPLSVEGGADVPKDGDVGYRRTLGIRLVTAGLDDVRRVAIFTRSTAARTTVRVRLDAGRRTKARTVGLATYNARLVSVAPRAKIEAGEATVPVAGSGSRAFDVTLEHMAPEHPYLGDDAHLRISLDAGGGQRRGREAFTICVQDLDRRGPIWYAEEGVYVTRADRDETFVAYRARHADSRTVLQRVAAEPEQSFAGAFLGQPRGHAVNFSLGCPNSPQRFWLEANGDLLLHRGNLDVLGRRPELAVRFLNRGSARFFFGLERWIACGRSDDPSTAPIYTMRFRRGPLVVEQEVLCVPLLRSILDGPLAWEEPTAALVRFRFANTGDAAERAVISIGYSQDSTRSRNALCDDPRMDDYRVPRNVRDPLRIEGDRITSAYEGRDVLRACCSPAGMAAAGRAGEAVLAGTLGPGERREVVLKIPYVAPDGPREIEALRDLDIERCRRELVHYWRAYNRTGAQLRTPVPHLDAVHAAHLTHVAITDVAMPGAPEMINTSVGSSTYGNFANEACMVIQELDQRGLREEVRKRLRVFTAYAGTARQPGNFTDFEGSFFGAGGWEWGDYNQHHGWVLWYLAEHFLLTRDRAWFAEIAPAVVAGADWVFRQRRTTMGRLPHSRGWESGFLPAGSLEDVTDFHYWLSTNALTWRGTDAAARALEACGHPEAGRVRRESDAYRADLLRGLEESRRHAPLVPLSDGRWVPHYPSRLYCRGRDRGWIREVLEGAVYLPISGLVAPDSREASWILDDLQDNLYHAPPYGYVLRDPEANRRHRGGFSIQPNLLAGLVPHLDRDEIEVYLWMFFNAWAACFREEVSGMVEHPMPELGFDNATAFKTSDEANAVMWLRAMMVYATPRLLHLGRAIPRAWLADGEEVSISGVRTPYGEVDARWASELSRGRIRLEARLDGPQDAPRTLARFRHPEKEPIVSATVNGAPWTRFEPVKGDVDITGLAGEVEVVATYAAEGR